MSAHLNAAPEQVQIDLKQYSVAADDFPQVVFSDDGRLVCTWWGAGNGPVEFLVFTRNGRLLGRSSDLNRPALISAFPEVAWRWQCQQFVKDAQFGGGQAFTFERDLSLGLKVVVPEHWPESSDPVTAELWKLSEPIRRMWRQALSRPWRPPQPGGASGATRGAAEPPIPSDQFTIAHATPVDLFSDLVEGPLLLNADGRHCAELDARTGKILRSFTFRPIESEAEARQRTKRFGGRTKDGDTAGFWVGSSAYDPKHGWIACGCSNDRRTRVIDVSDPTKIVFEANASENPFRPLGGSWAVPHLAFMSQGRYLLAGSEYTRRLGPYKLITEVFDTSSWRTVWSSRDSTLQSVAISGDGSTMAYVRGTLLVIGPFEPKRQRGRVP